MSILVRPALETDLDSPVRLNQQIQGQHAALYPELFYPPEQSARTARYFKKRIGQNHQNIVVADIDGHVFGYLWCEIFRKRRSPFTKGLSYLYVHHICVDVAEQRRGIGAALFDDMEKRAKTSGIRELRLGTWYLNSQAQAFFSSRGFTPYHIDMQKSL